MKSLGNPDATVHWMKKQPHSTETAEDPHRFKHSIDSRYLSVRKCILTDLSIEMTLLKTKGLTLSSTCTLATGITHSILCLF